LKCYDNCNKAFFPSTTCKKAPTDIVITLKGNTFDSFYKYPNPAYVKANFLDPTKNVKAPKRTTKYPIDMKLISTKEFKTYQDEFNTCEVLSKEVL